MIENIEDLEVSLKLEKGTLSGAIANEDNVKIDLSGLRINSLEDHETLISNTKKEGGKMANEILLKEMKETAGLDYEGRKDPANFIKALTEKAIKDSGVEPEKKFAELKTSFDALQTNFANEQTKYNDLVSETKANTLKATINNQISATIPSELKIPKEDALLLFNSKFKSELNEEGKLVISKDGTILKNDLQNPLSVSDVMTDFINPYLKEVEGGAGGKDNKKPNKPTSMDAFTKRMTDQGLKTGSAEFQKEMSKAIADKTLVI